MHASGLPVEIGCREDSQQKFVNSPDIIYDDCAYYGRYKTILVVDDEPGVTRIINRFMTRYGYEVIEAHDAGDARKIAREHRSGIDITMIDIFMPEMIGSDLVSELILYHPDMKVLYMSGTSYVSLVNDGYIQSDAAFLQKPFSTLDVLQIIRLMLDDG